MDMDMSQHSSLDFCQQYEYTVRPRNYSNWHIEVEFTAFVKCKAKPKISILSACVFSR